MTQGIYHKISVRSINHRRCMRLTGDGGDRIDAKKDDFEIHCYV